MFTQEAAGETILFPLFKYGRQLMSTQCIEKMRATHPLVDHLYKMTVIYPTKKAFQNFTQLREYNLDYAKKKEIPIEQINMFMACLIHYDLDVSNVMRFAGNNYTG